MYKNILLASDGSENAVRAAKKKLYKLASKSQMNQSLNVVYVIDLEKSKSDVLHSNSREAFRY